MNIYQSEIDDGLENLIKANNTLAFVSKPKLLDEPFQISEEKLKNFVAVATNQNQIDLHYLMSIMVSTGWNLNDDIFEKEEVWNAKNTPEDKQFNYEHNHDDIIGHITGSFILDDKMSVIDSNTKLEDVPDKFHIATSAVLYKVWRDKDKAERMQKIIANLKDWFVSMECVFGSFDYGLVDGEGKQSIVARNKETSFLTKCLRAYGGKGKYEDYKIGRLPRNIVFSGKGLVSSPANPESIIFTNTEKFSGIATKIFTINKNLGYLNNEVKSMENAMSKEVELQKELDTYKNKAEAFLKDLDANKLQLDKLQIEDKNLKALLASTQEDLKKEQEAKASLVKEFDTSKAEFKVIKDELDKIKADTKVKDRQNKIIAALKVKEDKAVELQKSFATLTDEMFEANLKVLVDNIKVPEIITNAKVEDEPNLGRGSEQVNPLVKVKEEIAKRFEKTKQKK